MTDNAPLSNEALSKPKPTSGASAPLLLLGLLAAGVVLLLISSGETGRPARGAQHPQVGAVLPSLRLEPLTGARQPVTLTELRGKVVLINYWGTWCPPCRQEFPHLISLWREYRGREEFQLLAVSCGPMAPPENMQDLRLATQRFLDSTQAALPTYADPDGFSRQAAQLQVYPTTQVLDRKGVIRGVWTGYEPGYEQEIRGLVDRLLSQP